MRQRPPRRRQVKPGRSTRRGTVRGYLARLQELDHAAVLMRVAGDPFRGEIGAAPRRLGVSVTRDVIEDLMFSEVWE
jgi:hypothetical protein